MRLRQVGVSDLASPRMAVALLLVGFGLMLAAVRLTPFGAWEFKRHSSLLWLPGGAFVGAGILNAVGCSVERRDCGLATSDRSNAFRHRVLTRRIALSPSCRDL